MQPNAKHSLDSEQECARLQGNTYGYAGAITWFLRGYRTGQGRLFREEHSTWSIRLQRTRWSACELPGGRKKIRRRVERCEMESDPGRMCEDECGAIH